MEIKEGDTVNENFLVLKRFVPQKSVFLVTRKSNGEKLVLKIIVGGTMNDEIKIGMEIGSECNYLVSIVQIIADVSMTKSVNILMEYCDGGDLSERIKKNKPATEAEIYRFMYEGAVSIQTLHKRKIIHRDIKPENFFLTKTGGFKLGDYSVACILDSTSLATMTRAGTPGYTSPEILNGEKLYTYKVDIYSFGVTALELITGRHPFKNEGGAYVMRSIIMGEPSTEVAKHPHPFAQLALRMIQLDPHARPDIEDVLGLQFAVLGPIHSLLERLEGERDVLKKRIDADADIPLPFRFCPQDPPGEVTYSGQTVVFTRMENGVNNRSVRVEPGALSQTRRVLSLEVSVLGDLNVGLAVRSAYPELHARCIHSRNDTCIFYYGGIATGLTFRVNTLHNWQVDSPSPTRVRLELDREVHTLHFFVGGSLVPHFLTGVPEDVFFAVGDGGWGPLSCRAEVHSYLALSAPTRIPLGRLVVCQGYSWVS